MNDSEYPIEALLSTNLDEELKTYSSISNQNMETFYTLADFICNPDDEQLNGNLWANLEDLNNCYNSNLKQINQYVKHISLMKDNVEILKKKNVQEKENTQDIKDIIEECITQYKKLTLNKEEAHRGITNKHNAFKHAMSYYKNCLDLYIHVEMKESMIQIKVCFFTKKMDDKYSVLLNRNTTENTWKLLETNPKLPEFQYSALQERLYHTNNISALIFTIRKIFNTHVCN